jgi:Uma2 family endonuclease
MAGPLMTFPPRPDGYTVDDVLALPGRIELIDGSLSLGTDMTVVQALEAYPDSQNIELVEGNLVVSPAPNPRHADAVHFVVRWLEDRLDLATWKVRENINVRIGVRTLLIPDATVYRADAQGDEAWIEAEAVALAVEVLSPGASGSQIGDKVARYRDAGVTAVWTIDLTDGSLSAHGNCELVNSADLADDLSAS